MGLKVLITGGAGFVGSSIAEHLLSRAGVEKVIVFDNLRRRGSELGVQRLIRKGAVFVHGDVRSPSDLEEISEPFDVLIEASAEPSVHAGLDGSPRYVLDTNLSGAINCLEVVRKRGAGLIFLSSSRVYPIAGLLEIPLTRSGDRLDLAQSVSLATGLSAEGISEVFSLSGPRSFYGASKLSAELICQEYAAAAGVPLVINRCGVIAGPWQFGKTDQGVFALWVAHHYFGLPLRYTGFGGDGLQVRDILHPRDLCYLLDIQISRMAEVSGHVFNVGGGRAGSVSLAEYTGICRSVIGQSVDIERITTTSAVDIPWYITNNAKVSAMLGWAPQFTPDMIVCEIAEWLAQDEARSRQIFAPN